MMTETEPLRNLVVGIGAQKCATTWLYQVLRDHPQMAMSASKELDFFSCYYSRGLQWYRRQFPALSGARLWGEISPSYFTCRDAPARLRYHAPQARLLVMLRDPVERAISNHHHEVRLGHFGGADLSFEAGLANNPCYLEQSRYGVMLRRWRRCFPPEQLLLLFQEDVLADPQAVARRLYAFLDLDPWQSRDLHVRSNVGHLYRFPWLEAWRLGLRNGCRRWGLDGLWPWLQKTGLQKSYRRLNRCSPQTRIPRVSEATRRQLRLWLASDIRHVEALSGRALPAWHGAVSGIGEAAEEGAAAGAWPPVQSATTWNKEL